MKNYWHKQRGNANLVTCVTNGHGNYQPCSAPLRNRFAGGSHHGSQAPMRGSPAPRGNKHARRSTMKTEYRKKTASTAPSFFAKKFSRQHARSERLCEILLAASPIAKVSYRHSLHLSQGGMAFSESSIALCCYFAGEWRRNQAILSRIACRMGVGSQPKVRRNLLSSMTKGFSHS